MQSIYGWKNQGKIAYRVREIHTDDCYTEAELLNSADLVTHLISGI